LLTGLAAIGAACFGAISVAEAQPANDNFANAWPITGLVTNGSSVGATKEAGEPNHAFNTGGPSVWFTWTAPKSMPVVIDTIGSSFDTLLAVYTGPAVNNLLTIASNDEAPGIGFVSLVQFQAVEGTVYRIAIDTWRPGSSFPSGGSYTLNIRPQATIAITSPANGTVIPVGTPIPVEIAGDVPNPPIVKASFYRRGVLFGTDDTEPFSGISSNGPAGSNSLQVVVLDGAGLSWTSAVVNVAVVDQGVTILSPADGASYFSTDPGRLLTTPIPVLAYPYLPTGSITNVEFLVDGQKFAEDNAPPFRQSWASVIGGAHRFTAIGKSDAGVSYNSQPVNIAVNQLFIARGSVWKYLDDGSNQATDWISPTFDDSLWASGPAELGYGDGDERTVVNGGPVNDHFITTYFRRSFVVTNAAAYSFVWVDVKRDDGAVIYLNGREMTRMNMPSGPIDYRTLAFEAFDDGTSYNLAVLPASFLVEGVNVMAVEIHQSAANSSDISFDLDFAGAPTITFNQSPSVTLTNPINGAVLIAPSLLTLEADAFDPDGTIARVEFFADDVKLAEFTNAPYRFDWISPPLGLHNLTAVATDNQGAVQISSPVIVTLYDELHTPIVKILQPQDGTVVEGPTNMIVTAYASALEGVTNVVFLANGSVIGQDDQSPYAVSWDAPFGSNVLTAVAYGANGLQGTSTLASVLITIPPTNTVAPFVATQIPVAFANITNVLTSILVRFSERVQGVDAADLLINGRPATGVSGSGSNYVFTFPQPPFGEVSVGFASDNGITDYGWPTVLPLDLDGPNARWEYELIDRVSPIISARTPAAGVTVTNLTQVSVTFSETVIGVDPEDLLVNGTPAFGLSGSGSNYTFTVSQPPSGAVTISWALNSAIFDTAEFPNLFNPNGTGASWSFTLDSRAILVQSNSNWKLLKGTAEASSPIDLWRQPAYDDTAWTVSPAPFFYGDPYTNAVIPGTFLGDMRGNYSSIFLRTEFDVSNVSAIESLLINAQFDDGFIAWVNGFEVLRVNMPPDGEIAYTGTAITSSTEPQGAGAAYVVFTLTNAPEHVISGRNELAIQGFNSSLAGSDFGFNAQLYAFLSDIGVRAPRVVQVTPAPGTIFGLTNFTVRFSEPVTGVDAADLLINTVPASSVSNISSSVYTFAFPQPPFGAVDITWARAHGIVDLDETPKPFDENAASSRAHYTLLNPSAPTVVFQTPAAGTRLTDLTTITVQFSEAVAGVEATDLLINGVPATGLSEIDPTNYSFTFPKPPFGSVSITWAASNGIHDLETPPNDFDPKRAGGVWSYVLVDPVPSVTILSPANNSAFLAGTNITLAASASDNDGFVERVAFFSGTNLLGERTSQPFSVIWSNVAYGEYTVYAVATDDSGLMSTSAPVNISVFTNVPIPLVRGPYLQVGTPTSGIIRWRSDLDSDSAVFWGTDSQQLTNSVVLSDQTNEHIVQISGLLPGTRYYYSIGSSGQRLARGTNYWFKTSPVPGSRGPTRLWVLGDSGTANINARNVRDAYYNFAATNRPADLWLMLGDNAYNSGLDSEYQNAVFETYPDTLRNLFLWPTIGNHETAQAYTAEDFPYLHIFTLPQNGEAGGVPSGSSRYYSFDYANIHLICLDSMSSGRTTNTAMAQWLLTDLASSGAEWTIVFFHHPPYTKGSHDSDFESDLIEMRSNILPIIEAYGVDLVLSGHSHSWERSYLLNGHYGFSTSLTSAMKIDPGNGREDGTGAYRKNEQGQGVVYTVAGNAGQTSFGSFDHPAHFLSLMELGSMIIDVSSNRLDARMLSASGVSRDHFTLLKRPAPAAPINLVATALGSDQIQLAWVDLSTNEIGFRVERSLDGTNFTYLTNVAANVTTANDSGLTPQTAYSYRVRAVNAAGESEFSNIATVTTASPCPVAIAQSVTVPEGGQIALTLSSQSGGSGSATGAGLSYRITRLPLNGDLSGTPPQLIYRPYTGYPSGGGHVDGSDSFTFTSSDGQCESPEATVSIVVTEVNDAPVGQISVLSPTCVLTAADASNPFVVVSNRAGGSIVTLGSATDHEADSIQYTWLLDGLPAGFGPVATNHLTVGCHTLGLTVSDGALSSSSELQLCAMTPAERIQQCKQLVEASSLPRQTKTPLLASLDASSASFDRGSFTPGVNQLEAFQNKVRAQVERNNPAMAYVLIQAAQQIIDALNCPTATFSIPVVVSRNISGGPLTIERVRGDLRACWTDPANEYVLESTDDLSSARWQTVNQGISSIGGGKIFSISNSIDVTHRFFRLRGKP